MKKIFRSIYVCEAILWAAITWGVIGITYIIVANVAPEKLATRVNEIDAQAIFFITFGGMFMYHISRNLLREGGEFIAFILIFPMVILIIGDMIRIIAHHTISLGDKELELSWLENRPPVKIKSAKSYKSEADSDIEEYVNKLRSVSTTSELRKYLSWVTRSKNPKYITPVMNCLNRFQNDTEEASFILDTVSDAMIKLAKNNKQRSDLVEGLKNKNPIIREACGITLKELNWKPENDEEKAWYLAALVKWNRIKKLGNASLEVSKHYLLHPYNIQAKKYAAEQLNRLGWEPETEEERLAYLIVLGEWDRLIELGEKAVNPLLTMLKGETQDTKVKSANTLATMCHDSKISDTSVQKIVHELILALDDSRWSVQESIKSSLVNIGSAAVPKIVSELADVLDRGNEVHWSISSHLTGSLIAIGKPAICEVENRLMSGSEVQGAVAMDILNKIG